MNLLFGILLSVQIIICLAMIGLILLQRSEGGALGMGGGPSGLVSARGAGNLLTRATGILGVAFFVNCIALTFVGQQQTANRSVIDQVGAQNVTLDPTKVAQPQARPEAQASSASSASAPSLTQLPMPTAQVAPSSAAPKPVAAAPVASPTDALNSLKALDKKKDAIMGSSSASKVAPPPQIPVTASGASQASSAQ